MKKIIFLIGLCACLSSCATIYTRETLQSTTFLDYRPYADADIFLSPDPYPGEFEPVGELYIVVDPAVVKNAVPEEDKFADNIYARNNLPPVKATTMPAEDLLEIAVKEAGLRGANGICNLSLEVQMVDYPYKKTWKAVLFMPAERYIIRGFCIKIP